MKKRIVYFLTLILFSLESIIVFKVNDKYLYAIYFIINLILLFIIISYIKYEQYIKLVVPDIHTNLYRNYDVLILGNRKLDIEIKKNYLDLRNYKRNLYTDILILERYYGFLKDNGKIIFYICKNDCKNLYSKHISIFDYEFLHSVTLLEHDLKIKSVKYYCYKVFRTIKFVLINKDIIRDFRVVNDVYIDENYIKEFCEKRNLKYEFIIIE